MIDVHCHILPGFDDGPEDWPTAIKMCRIAQRDGVNGVVATPHFFRGLFPTPDVRSVSDAVIELQNLCEKALVSGLQIYLGADCHVHPEIIENVKSGVVPTLNGSRYVLLELPDSAVPPGVKDLVFRMNIAGVIPIITHPERNEFLAQHPAMLYELIQGGAYAQVTGASLTGQFGGETRRAAELMVSTGLVQLIASDAHDPEKRQGILSPAAKAAAKLVGGDLADKMVYEVPRAILEDQPIRFPEPIRPTSAKKRGKSLWQRIRRG